MTSTGTPYLRTSLNKNYTGTADSNGEDRVSFLRGNAVTGMRTRPYIKGTATINKLGDIVSSQPQYVSSPNFGYAEDSYADFRTDKEDRAPMIYVGANDGMLHGFSAADGTEKIAYIPSEMYRTRSSQPLLSKLTESNYGQIANPHNYYVDGSPTVADVCAMNASCATSGDWKTILVGGLNGGGQGIYALNINTPANFNESNASSLVMWEFNDRQDTDADADMQYGLGYTYSRPTVARICTDRVNGSSMVPKACDDDKGRWVVIFGNGYNNSEADGYASTSGHAILYVLDALTGSVIKKINTKTGSSSIPNGLATPAAVDVDGDDYVDYVYAGDLLGNMWKIRPVANRQVDGTSPMPLVQRRYLYILQSMTPVQRLPVSRLLRPRKSSCIRKKVCWSCSAPVPTLPAMTRTIPVIRQFTVFGIRAPLFPQPIMTTCKSRQLTPSRRH